MNRTISIVVFAALFFIPSFVFASGGGGSCATQYPIVLAHGMGASAEILGTVDYWWGIEDALEDEGANVFITSVNGMDSTAAKAMDFKNQFLEILAVTGASKANIIGHSHGTLYTRYAMSNLGIGNRVASYTSLAGPHRGSELADLIMSMPDAFVGFAADALDVVYSFIFGDTNPDSFTNGIDVTTDYMINVFNPNTPDVNGVYYQSWAAKAKTAAPSVVLEPSWLIMLGLAGANDGLVSVNSAKWGNFRGIEDAAWYSPGCDHINLIGHFFGLTPGYDAGDFFTGIVSELKDMGY